jgi:aspartate 1-decarboxylase
VCTQSTATINSQADVTSLADCATISGTIVVSAKATGVISIDGPQKIIGDVICENAGGLITLGSSSITTINGAMKLTNLTLLSSLSMSSLKTCDTINWVALPALPQLGFSSVLTKSNSITISNTFLSTLDGIDIDTASTLQIDNNNQLKTFTTKATTVTSAININANANTLVASFPNLIWAANMTLRNASSVSIPALTAVNGSLGFYGNYMTSIAAPNLTSVGSLAFVANAKLANISVPILKTIGGANQIANNSALNAIDFPALTNVGGAIDFSGAFST